MIRKFILPAVLMSALAAPAFASVTVQLNDENTTKIRAMLTEQGYEVAKIKLEDGMYEAYARKDGQRYEVYLDAAFNIVKTDLDD
jgi:hypothetical protein